MDTVKLKELRQEEKDLLYEIRSNYRIYNFLPFEKRQKLSEMADRLNAVREEIKLLKGEK